MKISKERLARMIDHTLVRPDATKDEVIKLCEEASMCRFGCVCVNPPYVPLAARKLKGTKIKLSSTVGFPFGSTLPEVKAFEAKRSIEQGASEVDMVINLGLLKSGDYEAAKRDIEGVVKAAHPRALVKVIIEAGYLTDEEKITACKLAKEAGADFVKTSTGFFKGGAKVDDVKLMRKVAGASMGVKAAGGIRTLKDALAMIEAGADRIGTSSAVNIIEELSSQRHKRRIE